MCSATVGASPVWRCTCAASAIFSYGSRGTPGCANTLKRVPELPNAHDGSSIACTASWSEIEAKSLVMALSLLLLIRCCELELEVEDLGELHGGLVWSSGDRDEEVRHLRLPGRGARVGRQPGLGCDVVVGLE